MMEILSQEAMKYSSSPPVLFQFRQTAPLMGGAYEFRIERQVMTPDRPLNAGALYYFHTITASADVHEEDYAGAIAEIPKFSLYTKQNSSGPFLRDAVQLGKYLDNLPYKYAQTSVGDPNSFTGAIGGRLLQTASLIGKQSITITIILAANEVMNATQRGRGK